MTSTGIVRRIDGLGRIVLPKELRAILDLNDRDPLEIYTEGNTIILKKYEPACIFCNSTKRIGDGNDEVINYREGAAYWASTYSR